MKRYKTLGMILIILGFVIIIGNFLYEQYKEQREWEVQKINIDINNSNNLIIELDEPVGIKALQQQNNIIHILGSKGVKIKRRFYMVTNAIEVELQDTSISDILSIKGIKNIYTNDEILSLEEYTVESNVEDDGQVLKKEFTQNLWKRECYGQGVVVAIMGCGVSKDAIIRNGKSVVIDSYSITDNEYYGWHDTAVASVICMQPPVGITYEEYDYTGVAPLVDILSINIMGSDSLASPADVLAGCEWLVNWKQSHPGIPVIVSISWSKDPQRGWECGGWENPCILCEAINNMVKKYGFIVVCSAGNNGDADPDPLNYVPRYRSIGCPGQAEYAITVGAGIVSGFNECDFAIYAHSSYGPTTDGNRKPDIVAKGVRVISINSNSELTSYSGTSFAVPIVDGIIACILSKDTTKYNPYLIKDAIINTAIPYLGIEWENHSGYGLINSEGIYKYIFKSNLEEIINKIMDFIFSYNFLGIFMIVIGSILYKYPDLKKK